MTRYSTLDAFTITGRMEETPEGFLICRDVPLARTGDQVYAAHEVRGIPARGGQVIAQRDADEVFHPEAIASFNGKPLTDDHPDDDVGPANFKRHLIGTVMNPRRGAGSHAHCVVGDLIVYDAGAIAKIKAGKRELSCGYDADYEVVEPGRARQVNIRGNHVSLVDEGRCGADCAIRDRTPSMPKPARTSVPAVSSGRSFMDSLRAAFRATDEAQREEHLSAAEAEMPGDGGDHEGDGHHIVLNINGVPGADPQPQTVEAGKEGVTTKDEPMDEDQVKQIAANAVKEAVAPLVTAMEAIAAKLDGMSIKVDEASDKADAVAEAVEEMSDPDDAGTQDSIARAEILAPGLVMPTRDTKPGSKPHRDALVQFQREALKRALTTDAGRAAVAAVAGHAQPHRIVAMAPAEVGAVFRGASAILAGINTVDTGATLASATAGYVRDDKGQRVRPMNTADLAQIHRDHYAAQRRA